MLDALLTILLGWLFGLAFNKFFSDKVAPSWIIWTVTISSTLIMGVFGMVFGIMVGSKTLGGLVIFCWAFSLLTTINKHRNKLIASKQKSATEPLVSVNHPNGLKSHTQSNHAETEQLEFKVDSLAASAQRKDDLFEIAMVECNSEQRKAGLWARCFAETDGDEKKAQARYIKHRVAEEQERLEVESQTAKEQAQVEAMRNKGYCPNCSSVIFLKAKDCFHCKALFGGNSLWGPRVDKPHSY